MTGRDQQPPAYWRPSTVARFLGATPAEFRAKLPRLLEQGFPAPDPELGNYYARAVQDWVYARNPQAARAARLSDLTPIEPSSDAGSIDDRLERYERRWAG